MTVQYTIDNTLMGYVQSNDGERTWYAYSMQEHGTLDKKFDSVDKAALAVEEWANR